MASSGLRQKAHSTRHSTSRAKREAYRVEVGSAACKSRLAVRMRWWAVAAVYGEHPAARRLQLAREGPARLGESPVQLLL